MSIEKLKNLLREAEETVSTMWNGYVYGYCRDKNIYTYQYNMEYTMGRIAADPSLSPQKVFSEIIENTNGAEFEIKHPNGTRINHTTFKFECIINFDDGSSKNFLGYWEDLDPYYDTLSNVKVVD